MGNKSVLKIMTVICDMYKISRYKTSGPTEILLSK